MIFSVDFYVRRVVHIYAVGVAAKWFISRASVCIDSKIATDLGKLVTANSVLFFQTIIMTKLNLYCLSFL